MTPRGIFRAGDGSTGRERGIGSLARVDDAADRRGPYL